MSEEHSFESLNLLTNTEDNLPLRHSTVYQILADGGNESVERSFEHGAECQKSIDLKWHGKEECTASVTCTALDETACENYGLSVGFGNSPARK